MADVSTHELIARRFSPYAFSPRAVAPEDLHALFEAARWAPSCYNEQPWRYLLATKADPAEFERLLSCLVEGNQKWAGDAPVLAIGCVRTRFARNGKPNAHAHHDLGLASAQLTLEAGARDLFVHQMAGILPDRVRELYDLPPEFEAHTGLAIGHLPGPDDGLAPEVLERNEKVRQRRPLERVVFTGRFGEAARLTS